MQEDGNSLAPGDVIAGRYRVEALLGQGGFGAVYRCAQLDQPRSVALKMLLPEAIGNEEAFARFRREAELARRLQHPNTVRILDFGETDDGLLYIAWELLRGRPLDAVLREEGSLPPARVARIAAQILEALTEAHGLGIVHRDIKPGNIFLCEAPGEPFHGGAAGGPTRLVERPPAGPDFVKVLDFGVAKTTRGGKAITMVGSIIGTVSYMAPEQLKSADVSPASDVYALGLLMGEALSGQPAYGGAGGAKLVMAQLSDTPAVMPPSVTGSPLGPIILRAIQKKPAARYPDAAAMMAQLRPVLASLVPPARPGPTAGAQAFVSADTVLAFPAPSSAPTIPGPSAVFRPPPAPGPAAPPAAPDQPHFQGTVLMWRQAPPAQPGAVSGPLPHPTFGAPPLPVPSPPTARPAETVPQPGPLSRGRAGRRNLLLGVFAGAVSVLVVLIVTVLVVRVIRARAEHHDHNAEPHRPPRLP
jgi:serine/threonine-protein kinase